MHSAYPLKQLSSLQIWETFFEQVHGKQAVVPGRHRAKAQPGCLSIAQAHREPNRVLEDELRSLANLAACQFSPLDFRLLNIPVGTSSANPQDSRGITIPTCSMPACVPSPLHQLSFSVRFIQHFMTKSEYLWQ